MTPVASARLVDGHFIVFTEFGQLLLVARDPTRYQEVARMDLGPRRQAIAPLSLLGRPGVIARPPVPSWHGSGSCVWN